MPLKYDKMPKDSLRTRKSSLLLRIKRSSSNCSLAKAFTRRIPLRASSACAETSPDFSRLRRKARFIFLLTKTECTALIISIAPIIEPRYGFRYSIMKIVPSILMVQTRRSLGPLNVSSLISTISLVMRDSSCPVRALSKKRKDIFSICPNKSRRISFSMPELIT